MSKYFRTIPTLRYETFDGSGASKVVTNIFTRVRIKLEAKTDRAVYYKYDVRDGQSPETIAHKYYGSTDYMWVVLMFNDMIDPKFDWVLNQNELWKYIINKYGSISEAQGTIHHYETKRILAPETGYGYTKGEPVLPKGIVVDSDYTFSYGPKSGSFSFNPDQSRSSVSNYDYEESENEKKRSIRLLRREFLPQIVEEFENLVITKLV